MQGTVKNFGKVMDLFVERMIKSISFTIPI